MKQHVLFKRPVELDTLHVVQYLYSLGHDVRAEACIERNHPEWAVESLPCIETAAGERHVGLDACVRFYAACASVPASSLVAEAVAFKQAHPEYRISSARKLVL